MAKKKMKIPTAAATAPTSGRDSTREISERDAGGGGRSGVRAGGTTVGALMMCSGQRLLFAV
jgi:hypothetical protein